ncbi:MAG: nicotinate-nucleotide adenylyltransferase [Chloroflexi bacterium]|nr:nicotinate-nucleotide adenylyltransferase [Chloroflexota bacterium]
MKRYGIFGGTFNPPHYGHLLAAQTALEHCSLDRILLIPNRIPPHKQLEEPGGNPEHRYNMILLAARGNPDFQVLRTELDDERTSFSLYTVEKLKTEFPGGSFSLITGADSLLKSSWYRLDDLLGLLENFYIVTRPGYDTGELAEHIESLILKNADRFKTVPIPGFDISSTGIRERVKNGRSIRYMVPEAVEKYIHENELYL